MHRSYPAWVMLVDKPEGMTSYGVVAHAKKVFKARRVGHTGTLDPFATGLLILCFGKATKIAGFLVELEKEYVAGVRLGQKTDTDDLTGKVMEEKKVGTISKDEILAVLKKFVGRTEQLPPSVSALKYQGERHYALVRKGIEAKRTPREVVMREIELLDFAPPDLTLKVVCSRGTYVRALARDIGEALGVGGHLFSLRRTRMGEFQVDQAIKFSEIGEEPHESQAKSRLTMDEALSFLDAISIREESVGRFLHGVPPLKDEVLSQPNEWSGLKRVLGEDGRLLGIANLSTAGEVKLVRVLSGSGAGNENS
ncbi:MAG: tRNA pseudouridine(55) synthase TruB [Candidatus Eisenbacteria bacterium]|nr:tRNA pseudouridine(55) synthase TruB [Candidatus Eisenbacteria bacterium]